MAKKDKFLEYTIHGKVRIPAGNPGDIEAALKPIRKVFEAAGGTSEVASVRTRSVAAVTQAQEAAE